MKKILLLLLLLSVFATLMWVAFWAGGNTKTAKASGQQMPAVSGTSSAKKAIPERPRPMVVQSPLSPAEQQAALDEGELISDLFDAAIEGTPEKTESVYAALSHPNDAVREGALDVIIQYMGRESVPRLRAALASARTPEEKTRLQEAIEFIELPTLSELKGSAPRPPRGQAAGQKSAQPGIPNLLRKKPPPVPQQ